MEGLEGGKGEVEGEEREGVELVEEEGREMEEINDEELMPSVTFLVKTSFCGKMFIINTTTSVEFDQNMWCLSQNLTDVVVFNI